MIKAAHLIVCACVMSELYVLVDVSICSGRGIGDNWQVGVKGSAQAQLSYLYIVWPILFLVVLQCGDRVFQQGQCKIQCKMS